MVVDDNEPAGYLLGRLLQKMGQHVHTVQSAQAALEDAPILNPDVIISDIAMPGMSGYDLAERIRAQPNLRHPVLIALTGYGQDSDRQRAREAGFDHHLTKPVGLAALEQIFTTFAVAPEATCTNSA
jgi:CheY-like chemotaxis protein